MTTAIPLDPESLAARMVAELEQNPDLKPILLRALLTDEFLMLPAKVDQLMDRVERLEGRFGNLEERFGDMEERFSKQEERFANLEERFSKQEERFSNQEGRLNSLEGRFSNFEGSDYERRIRTRALNRAEYRFNLNNPQITLTQDGHKAPELNSAISRALRAGSISREQSEELHEVDIIISDQDNRHVVIEVSLTADNPDITRARNRADILSRATAGVVLPALVTANLNEPQRSLADAQDVAVFIIPYP